MHPIIAARKEPDDGSSITWTQLTSQSSCAVVGASGAQTRCDAALAALQNVERWRGAQALLWGRYRCTRHGDKDQ